VGSKRPHASRELAGTVERGKNPEDGTDGGLATLVPHGSPRGDAWQEKGTRRSSVRGSKNPRRDETRRLWNDTAPFGGTCRRRGERVEAKLTTLKMHLTP